MLDKDGAEITPSARRTLISPESLVPIGVAAAIVVAVCGGVLGGYTWLDSQFDDLVLSVNSVRSEQATAFGAIKSEQATALGLIKSEQATAIAKIDNRIEDIQGNVDSMERVLSDRLTKSEFDTWVKLFFASNPNLTRP